MKKILSAALVLGVLGAGTVLAGPPPPPECGPCRRHDCGSDGVRMAANILSLVGAGLNILRGPQTIVVNQPAVEVQPAVVTEPIVVPQPVIVSRPVCYPYYYRRPCRPCRPGRPGPGPCRPCHRK